MQFHIEEKKNHRTNKITHLLSKQLQKKIYQLAIKLTSNKNSRPDVLVKQQKLHEESSKYKSPIRTTLAISHYINA